MLSWHNHIIHMIISCVKHVKQNAKKQNVKTKYKEGKL